jgi:hypothetical protein
MTSEYIKGMVKGIELYHSILEKNFPKFLEMAEKGAITKLEQSPIDIIPITKTQYKS